MSENIELTDYQLSNVSISELSDISRTYGEIDENSYFIISHPWEDGISKYISQKVKYSELREQITEDIDLQFLSDCIEDIYKNYLSCLSDIVEVNVDAENPYIVSAIVEYHGRLVDMRGYRLQDGMETVFGKYKFPKLSVQFLNADDILNINLSSHKANISDVYADNIHVTWIYAQNGIITSLTSTTSNISTLYATRGYVQQCDTEPTLNSASIINSDKLKKTMDKYFMSGYSNTNQLAHRDFVNSSIENAAASYVTKHHSYDGTGKSSPFTTYADLSSSQLTDLYKDGKQCGSTNDSSHSILNKNDYCYILSDEHATEWTYPISVPKTTRYRFTDISCTTSTYNVSAWTFMYHVNNSPFTDAQWKSINSGITKENKVTHTENTAIGNGKNLLYVLSSGQIQTSNLTVGTNLKPVYLSNGTLTQCNEMVDITTKQNVTGDKNFNQLSAGNFNFHGISSSSASSPTPIWFSTSNSQKGTPAGDDNFTYNPTTNTLCVERINAVSCHIESLSVTSFDIGKLHIIGNNCDVLYTTPNGVVKQSILRDDIYACNTDAEVLSCLSQHLSPAVDTRVKTLSTYNTQTGQWTQTSTGQATLSACGFGRIIQNANTKKCFYVKGDSIVQIVDNYEEEFAAINSKIDAQLTKLQSIV